MKSCHNVKTPSLLRLKVSQQLASNIRQGKVNLDNPAIVELSDDISHMSDPSERSKRPTKLSPAQYVGLTDS